MDANNAITFDPDLVRSIFNMVWSRSMEKKAKKDKRSTAEEEEEQQDEELQVMDVEAGTGTAKKNRQTTANLSSLKISCELLRLFVTEAVERAAIIAEAEGIQNVEPAHLERILPQLLLDF